MRVHLWRPRREKRAASWEREGGVPREAWVRMGLGRRRGGLVRRQHEGSRVGGGGHADRLLAELQFLALVGHHGHEVEARGRLAGVARGGLVGWFGRILGRKCKC